MLLTYQGDLWLNRLADGGAALPHDPLKETASLCEGETRAQLGWAVGYGASTAEASFVLPADPLSPDPTVSRFTATVTLGYSGMPGIAFGPLAARSLPPPLDYVAPSIETLLARARAHLRRHPGSRHRGRSGGRPLRDVQHRRDRPLGRARGGGSALARLRRLRRADDRRPRRPRRGVAGRGQAARRRAARPPLCSHDPRHDQERVRLLEARRPRRRARVWAGSARPPAGPRRRARTPAMPRPHARPPPLPRSRSRRPRPRAPRPAASSSRESCTGWTST